MSNNDELTRTRHSLAHIMASAVKRIWTDAKFGVGPAIENGFYYDIDLGEQSISEEDFGKITSEMIKIIKDNQPFEKYSLNIDEAIDWAKRENQPYKLELLNDLKRDGTTVAQDIDSSNLGTESSGESKVEKVSFYKNGEFSDLCKGPHVNSTGEVGPFKLMRLSGAYWRGRNENAQMQRIYGVAFLTQAELDTYLDNIEKAKKYDHRKLGQELDLFVISPLVGSGLPLFTPRGTVLREELNRYSQELRKKIGYQTVWTPHLAKQDLYEKSGHWAKFGDEWLTVNSQETHDHLVMKPMNCPHHQQIYSSRPRSYRDLPLKYMETTTDYRDEKAGEMLGLARVRSITQDDSHTFCTIDQINEVLTSLIEVVKEFYRTIDLEVRVRLSFRDKSNNYLGDEKLWEKAQNIIKEVVEAIGFEYYISEGDAAFYGPKIDFIATDSLGRELQLGTPQLDFVQPERFGLKYADEDGGEKTPVMIHFALMGSIERFLAAYIEHTLGKFPLWVSPEQIRILTVNQNEQIIEFANEIVNKATSRNLRINLDSASESVGKKIRDAEIYKVPYVVVIGTKELESSKVTPRIRDDLKEKSEEIAYSVEEFLDKLVMEVNSRSLKSSL